MNKIHRQAARIKNHLGRNKLPYVVGFAAIATVANVACQVKASYDLADALGEFNPETGEFVIIEDHETTIS